MRGSDADDRAEELERQVRWHRYVTDEQLAASTRGARAFAFLSEYEGLGLTPLEALAAGVAARAPRHAGRARKLRRRGALRRGSRFAGTTARSNAALFDEAVRARILAAAPRELAKYNWSGRRARHAVGARTGWRSRAGRAT